MERIQRAITAIDTRLSSLVQDLAPNLNSYMLIFIFVSMGFMIGHFFNTGIYWLSCLLTLAYIFVHRINDEILDRYDATIHELYTSSFTSRLAELVIIAGMGTSPEIDPRLGFAALIAYMLSFFSGYYTDQHFDIEEYTFSEFRPALFYIISVAAAIATIDGRAMILGLVSVIILFLAAFIQETKAFIKPIATEDTKEA